MLQFGMSRYVEGEGRTAEQYLMINFIHNFQELDMFQTSVIHLQERSYAVCCNLVCLDTLWGRAVLTTTGQLSVASMLERANKNGLMIWLEDGKPGSFDAYVEGEELICELDGPFLFSKTEELTAVHVTVKRQLLHIRLCPGDGSTVFFCRRSLGGRNGTIRVYRLSEDCILIFVSFPVKNID